MAFPTVVNSATSSASPASFGSVTPTMPTSIVANNLLIGILASNNNAFGASITGYTALGETDRTTGATSSLAAYTRKATATSADNISFATPGGILYVSIVYQISGWSGTLTDCKWAATNASMTPPALTPGFGTLDYLWLAAALNNTGTITAAPSGFTGLLTKANSYTVGTATLSATASSETPGAFGGTAANPQAATISIKPVASSSAASPMLQTPLVPRLRSFNW